MSDLSKEFLAERDLASTWAAIGFTATFIGSNCAVCFESDTGAYVGGVGLVMMTLGFLKMYIENRNAGPSLSSDQ